MQNPPNLRPSHAVALSAGISLVVLGIALNVLSRPLDGFVHGLLIGAGLTTILMGVWVMSPLLRRRDSEDSAAEDTWLPSRDGDR